MFKIDNSNHLEVYAEIFTERLSWWIWLKTFGLGKKANGKENFYNSRVFDFPLLNLETFKQFLLAKNFCLFVGIYKWLYWEENHPYH